MNLNGGYVMIDLDNTKDLLERTKQAYESRKPLIVRYNGRLDFAAFKERTSSISDYQVALSNNTLLSIHYFTGTLTALNVVKPVVRHTIVLSFSIGSTTHKISFEIISTTQDTPYISSANVVQEIYNNKHVTQESSLLVNDIIGGYANVYAVENNGVFNLYAKPSGSSSYTKLTGVTLVSDEVTIV